MDRANLTVLSAALVTRVTFEGKRATGVEIYHEGKTKQIRAGLEVVLSLGAINTPKVLMQSGIGDQTELARHGIPVIQNLPGVGQNFQDHPAIWCVWEFPAPSTPPNRISPIKWNVKRKTSPHWLRYRANVVIAFSPTV
jgi:choline dehydrogenase